MNKLLTYNYYLKTFEKLNFESNFNITFQDNNIRIGKNTWQLLK